MNIIASIQARMGSTRLPGKVLKPILGKPVLQWHIERIKLSRLIDDVVVATTTSQKDDQIVDLCEEIGVKYYRGSEKDVLNRIASLVAQFNADIHVECFGDSPLTDPQMIDEYIGYLLKNKEIEFVSNSIQTTYPPGSEVLVYYGKVLLDANNRIKKNNPLREHVSLHIYKRDDLYNIVNITAPDLYRYPNLYIEIDTDKDFIVMESIISTLSKKYGIGFPLITVIDYLKEHPEIVQINQDVPRRWKEFRSNV